MILLENQLRLCDNTNEHFALYVEMTCPMVRQHRLRIGLFVIDVIIELLFAIVNSAFRTCVCFYQIADAHIVISVIKNYLHAKALW